jgi:hypothetical protein
VQSVTDRAVLAALRDAAADINAQLRALTGRDTTSAAIRREQLQTVKRHILRTQADLWDSLGRTISASRARAAAAAIDVGSEIDAYLLRGTRSASAAGVIKASLERGLISGVETMVERMTHTAIPLSDRVYRSRVLMSGRVDRLVNSALARGLSAREFAAEVRRYSDPSTPGGVRYAAMRLSRTEINNAFHATSVRVEADKPWVSGMAWHLSGSHPRPDICDDYARRDKFDMGPGVFPVRDVPAKPHPHCLCYVSPETPDREQFLDNLVSGQYNDYLRANY